MSIFGLIEENMELSHIHLAVLTLDSEVDGNKFGKVNKCRA